MFIKFSGHVSLGDVGHFNNRKWLLWYKVGRSFEIFVRKSEKKKRKKKEKKK